MLHIDYHGHPVKPLKQLLHQYSTNYLILDDVLANEESYQYIYQDILDLLKYGVEYKPIRELPISFIIHREDGTKPNDLSGLHVLEARHFLSNMVMWYAFMKMDRVEIMDESFIIDWRDKPIKFIADYIDTKISPNFDGDFHSLNAICDEIVFHIKAISDAFCLIFGFSASIYDIMKAEEADSEIHDAIYGHLDTTLQPKEMEDAMNERNAKLMDALARSDSDLAPLLRSGSNLSKDQCREIFLCIGYKADMNNRTVPYFIDKNLLITGIDDPASFYIIAGAGRKSLMDTKLSMARPGAMSKKMNHNTTPIVLRKDRVHCNSTRPIYYTIEDETFLSLLDKRWYYDEDGQLKLLDGKRDTHLIGKRLGFRSPCTCNSKEGVCELCYGTLFDINDDLFSQGSLAATKLSEPIGQLILKSKHVQTTSSDEIGFDENFYKNFDLSSTEITLNDNADEVLFLSLGEVKTEETDDGDVYYVESYDVLDVTGELKYHIEESHGFNMYLSNDLFKAWKQFKDKPIPMDYFNDDDDDTILFNIEVKSKAITQSTQLFSAALDSKDHLGCTHDVDGLCQKFARILIDSGIKYNLVHAEMVIRGLMRKADNDLEYPDFGPNDDHENYTILRLTSSLNRSPSPIIRLSTGWLKKSLIGTALYKADMPSHLDPFFVSNLSDVI